MYRSNDIFGLFGIVSKYILAFLMPFVEPQIAGILGGLTYLIVRHELNMGSFCFKSLLIVMFFGWMGAWCVVNIVAEHWNWLPDVYVHILSATVGFLSYEALLMFGKNTKSVIGFLFDVIKVLAIKGFKKWKS